MDYENLTPVEIFNVGSDDKIDVNSIAQIILDQIVFANSTKINYISTTPDGRGWDGDVKDMLLSTDRIKKFGWKIRRSSLDSVVNTVKRVGYSVTN